MLKNEIEKKRRHLHDKINEKGDLTHCEVLHASMVLDTLIQKYNQMKLR